MSLNDLVKQIGTLTRENADLHEIRLRQAVEIERLKAQAPAKQGAGSECVWDYDELHDMWETACGQAWCCLEGTLKDNGIRFCPFCGKAIADALNREGEG